MTEKLPPDELLLDQAQRDLERDNNIEPLLHLIDRTHELVMRGYRGEVLPIDRVGFNGTDHTLEVRLKGAGTPVTVPVSSISKLISIRLRQART